MNNHTFNILIVFSTFLFKAYEVHMWRKALYLYQKCYNNFSLARCVIPQHECTIYSVRTSKLFLQRIWRLVFSLFYVWAVHASHDVAGFVNATEFRALNLKHEKASREADSVLKFEVDLVEEPVSIKMVKVMELLAFLSFHKLHCSALRLLSCFKECARWRWSLLAHG